MSRIIVYGLDNTPVGEFSATCNRGWILLGNSAVEGGGQTSVNIPPEVAQQPWLQLGRVVLVDHPTLPPWAGVIDTPWHAAEPINISLYNIESLFSLRAAEKSVSLMGVPFPQVMSEAIRVANDPENMHILLGNTGNLQDPVNKTIEQGGLWDQIMTFLVESGYEMYLRPQRDLANKLSIYVDVGIGIGAQTNYLLHDGVGGNMKIVDAVVNGRIINRVKAVSGSNTEETQLESDVLINTTSQGIYRTRSEVIRFDNVTQKTVINQYAQTYLDVSSLPYLDLTVDISDTGAFPNLRIGNVLAVHAAGVYLPGGRKGWRGYSRILAMAYDENANTVKTTLRGAL